MKTAEQNGLAKMIRNALILIACLAVLPIAGHARSPALTGPAAEVAVEACLAGDGEIVEMLSDGESICWRSGIFPLQFLKLGELVPDAKRMVLSSRGGNVLTAITMANYLRGAELPVIIAGECVSACASVITPGLEGGRIHESAFFLVHGITSYDARTFLADFRARKGADDESAADSFVTGLMMPNAWNYYSVQWPRTVGFLEKRGIPVSYMTEPETRMKAAKDTLGCPLELFDYFALLERGHVLAHVGARFAVVDDFADDWSDDRLSKYREALTPISADGVVAYSAKLEQEGC
jgi:hypothetical protein